MNMGKYNMNMENQKLKCATMQNWIFKIKQLRRAKRARNFIQGFTIFHKKLLKITPKSPQTLLYLLKLTAIPLETSPNRRAHKFTSSQANTSSINTFITATSRKENANRNEMKTK